MLRCVLLAAAFAAAPFAAPLAAHAQVVRNFPANALRGDIAVVQPPDLLLNKQPARLSPGARIRGTNNLLQVTGTLANQTLVVNYTLDLLGQVHEVWVLTADEAARKPWPTTPQQAAAWTFDPIAQTWSRP